MNLKKMNLVELNVIEKRKTEGGGWFSWFSNWGSPGFNLPYDYVYVQPKLMA
jgi:hypothetical protein